MVQMQAHPGEEASLCATRKRDSECISISDSVHVGVITRDDMSHNYPMNVPYLGGRGIYGRGPLTSAQFVGMKPAGSGDLCGGGILAFSLSAIVTSFVGFVVALTDFFADFLGGHERIRTSCASIEWVVVISDIIQLCS